MLDRQETIPGYDATPVTRITLTFGRVGWTGCSRKQADLQSRNTIGRILSLARVAFT